MSEPSDVSESIRNVSVDREQFEDAVRRLLRSSPLPRTAISKKLERERRQERIRSKLLIERSR